MSSVKTQRIVIVAGEASGDILGAGLIRALKDTYPKAVFEGIGGPLMKAEGFTSLFPMERLSVMGLVDPLLRLPELLSILKQLKTSCLKNPPEFFVGIDSPDFNLRLEKPLKKSGIFTVHYVSPSVWAWRQGRIKTIKQSVDLMLTLFPFEAQFYKDNNVPVRFVGHPLADEIALQPNMDKARRELGLEDNKKYIAIMPGSRGSEVEKLWPILLHTMALITREKKSVVFLIPAANSARREQLNALLNSSDTENIIDRNCISVFDGRSKKIMAASDLVIMTSGTTTLEAMLLKKPMIVCYKMSRLSFAIISRLVKVSYIALPNLLANKELVPEFIQDNAIPEDISRKALSYLNQNMHTQNLLQEFQSIHLSLKKDASNNASQAIIEHVLNSTNNN